MRVTAPGESPRGALSLIPFTSLLTSPRQWFFVGFFGSSGNAVCCASTPKVRRFSRTFRNKEGIAKKTTTRQHLLRRIRTVADEIRTTAGEFPNCVVKTSAIHKTSSEGN